MAEIFKPGYNESHALIIGIDDYETAPKLSYAVSDAEAINDSLIKNFSFKKKNIQLLKNKEATRENISKAYLSYVNENISPDDKILFFFAGHGVTQPGRRGETGYLVPYEGQRALLSTLIRWDEFTRNADLIPAKHILYIMDACYGGLAVTRSLQAGSVRFLKDMTTRFTRQVITAGKANQVVADAGGPVPNHSVFTGHLLQALDGRGADTEGNITANGIMAYVYEHVAQDKNSNQTPHYGFIDGDGDFIFKAPKLQELEKIIEKDEDILVAVPSVFLDNRQQQNLDIVELTKEYLSDSKYRIKLSDFVNNEVRKIVQQLSDPVFDASVSYSFEEFKKRINKYELIIKDIQKILAIIAYWGTDQHLSIIKTAFSRLMDHFSEPKSGLTIFITLQWYPILLLAYSVGISSIANNNYASLAAMLLADVKSGSHKNSNEKLVNALGNCIVDIARTEVFKQLPEHARHYVPMSEYMFKLLQPNLDDLLFLGKDYEIYYDKFELFMSLVHADLADRKGKRLWGPIGRFGWKRDREDDPYEKLVEEIKDKNDNWDPIQAGLFQEMAGFKTLLQKYNEELLSKINWW
ncbi:MAG: caspase family protein [Alphaproteobacteria bacterium]|jgi:hypothetical protein|nr:caspase family protein [Alphaproteobacteria bacterium]